MKKGINMLIVLLLCTLAMSACGKNANQDDVNKKTETATETKTETVTETATETETETVTSTDTEKENSMEQYKFEATHKVEIEIEGYGTIAVELDGNVAPITVDNFVTLAKDGFYDGLTFHRIISGFMIQGGDPDGNGTGGSDKEIQGEFAINGVNNPISHTRGAISMARSQAVNSASSQFFIVHEDSQFLDGQYAAFGYVTSGMEVVDKVCEDTPVVDGNGTVVKEKQPIITSIKVIE